MQKPILFTLILAPASLAFSLSEYTSLISGDNAPTYTPKVNEVPANPRVTDTFYPELRNGDRVWLVADMLWFVPDEDALAFTNEKTDLFVSPVVTRKCVIEPEFDWDFGFRVGLGYIFSDRKWDMSLSWLHFATSSQQTIDTDLGIGCVQFGRFPIWSLSCDTLCFDFITQAKMHWKLKINLLDLTFGRLFEFGKTFFLRPFFGLRGAWIDQRDKVQYSGGVFVNGLTVSQLLSMCGDDHIFMKNNFWGVGPIVGIEPQLNLGRGLRVYAGVAGTGAVGQFNIHQKERYLDSVRFNHHDHPVKWRWILDADAGIMWETWLCSQRFALTFKFGWEYHLFFDQLELRGDKFGLVSDDRNLSLNGVAFSSRFDF